MIQQVDDAILAALKRGLKEIVPPGDIILGAMPESSRGVALLCNDFTLDERGMGGSVSVAYEEVSESFDADGSGKAFRLSRGPARAVLGVESPLGVIRREIDDYVIDPSRSVISFRTAPKKAKGSVQVRYSTPRAVGEIGSLSLVMRYAVLIRSKDVRERERIALEAINALFRDKGELKAQGLEDVRLVEGYRGASPYDDQVDMWTLEYEVRTTLSIGMPPATAMAKIAVAPIEKK
jgi:hypothetical protein